MSRRREIEGRLESLGDIRNILGAMKNLALMEMRKLTHLVSTQRKVVEGVEAAAADLLQAHPQLVAAPVRTVYLALGSERGFCGDFNEALARGLRAQLAAPGTGPPLVVAVGRRLWPKLADLQPASLEGPSVVEEVEPALARVMHTLGTMQSRQQPPGPCRLTALHHCWGDKKISISSFAPFRDGTARPRPHSHPPLTYVEPQSLITDLVEHYLFAALCALFYDSLMAESARRLQHMESAIRRLEQRCEELRLRRNIVRQEEITQEIEIIILSVEALRQTPGPSELRALTKI